MNKKEIEKALMDAVMTGEGMIYVDPASFYKRAAWYKRWWWLIKYAAVDKHCYARWWGYIVGAIVGYCFGRYGR